MRSITALASVLALVLVASGASAGAAKGGSAGSTKAKATLRPIDPKNAKSTHGPFESGECSVCHTSDDAAKPGPLARTGDSLCFDCHDEFLKGTATAKHLKHPKPHQGCLGCHNPHNSENRALLVK